MGGLDYFDFYTHASVRTFSSLVGVGFNRAAARCRRGLGGKAVVLALSRVAA